MTVTETWSDWSCTVRVAVGQPEQLDVAVRHVRRVMAQVDRSASRFRPDSELSVCNARAG